jgi:hypothetical protein
MLEDRRAANLDKQARVALKFCFYFYFYFIFDLLAGDAGGSPCCQLG